MSDRVDAQNDAAAQAGAAGCAVFLIDESAAMETRVAGGTKSKADCIATALNSLLSQLSAGTGLDVAVVGYRGDAPAGVNAGCRWAGTLAERTFVPCGELAGAVLKVEDRVRKIPGPGGIGVGREETVRFPVWYVPTLGGAASPAAAYDFCRELISARIADCPDCGKPPLLVSFVGEPSETESLRAAAGRLQSPESTAGGPLVLHAHLSTSARIPPTLYPAADGHLPPAVQEVFQSTSVLPGAFADALRQAQMTVNAGARGMIYNATMADLIRFLSLVKAYAAYRPPATLQPASAAAGAETPIPETAPEPTEAIGLIVLLLDRSAEDPSDQGKAAAWRRLQDHANELLGEIAKRGRGKIDAAVVSYGTGGDGLTEVRTAFEGPLQGKTFVPNTELADGPLRVEEFTQQVSNGIGGLIELKRKRPIFVDLPAAGPAPAAPALALEAVGELAVQWRGRHPGGLGPVVLHLTRGRLDPGQLEQVTAGWVLYHLVVTESPHRSLSYPGQPAEIDDPILEKLWKASSPLLGASRLAAEKPAVARNARGIVINGKFDLLLDGVLQSISKVDEDAV